MAHAAFTQSIYIAATPDAVKVSLADYSYHSAIHPMIVRVQVLDHTTGPDGTPLRRSKISDRMRMGPFTFAITYLATILACILTSSKWSAKVEWTARDS
jgi:hypothetical protein